jgi:hypothetical protein
MMGLAKRIDRIEIRRMYLVGLFGVLVLGLGISRDAWNINL